jgi:alanine racemase
LVRPGLMLYGVSPAPHLGSRVELTQVMSLRSEVVYFKVVPQGAGVSYGLTWKAPCQTRVITVPVGYGDGYSRRLSNCGNVLIHGKRYPIVGRVCCDQFMVDIGDGEAYNGDEVVLIGQQGEQRITVEEVGELIDTDLRDVLISLNQRVPRRYHYKGEVFVG